jgi:hypothetical protein
VAYEAYNRDRGGVAYDGSPIPSWGAVREDIRHAWIVAAKAVYDHLHEPIPKAGEVTAA